MYLKTIASGPRGLSLQHFVRFQERRRPAPRQPSMNGVDGIPIPRPVLTPFDRLCERESLAFIRVDSSTNHARNVHSRDPRTFDRASDRQAASMSRQ